MQKIFQPLVMIGTILLFEPALAVELFPGQADKEGCFDKGLSVVFPANRGLFEMLGIKTPDDFKRLLKLPYFQRLMNIAEQASHQISGYVDFEKGEKIDGKQNFSITDTRKDYSGEEGQRRYEEVLSQICRQISQYEGLNLTERCIEMSKKSLAALQQQIEGSREYAENFAEKYWKNFDGKKWKDFKAPSRFRCALDSPELKLPDHPDPVLGTALCYGQSYRVPVDHPAFSSLLIDQKGRPVGRVVQMSVGSKIETFYAPFISDDLGSGLLNPIFFSVFGGSAEDWNKLILERYGSLQII